MEKYFRGMKNKYGNRKTIIDGVTFDSRRESERYCELKLLERAKRIKGLKLQPKFTLQEGFKDKKGKYHRSIVYIADFSYFDVDNDKEIVEDTKGVETEIFKIKRKLLLNKYPDINLRIVR